MRLSAAHYPDRAPIDAYGNGGFRFAEMSHRGSILALPSGIHGWEPAAPPNLSIADFEILLDAAEKPEILLIGTGVNIVPQSQELLTALKSHGMGIDCMSTGAAARTYNILLSESRPVGAALIAV